MQITPNTPLALNLTLEKANLILTSLGAFNEKISAIHQEITAQAQQQIQALQNSEEDANP
jgi:hypothetical protein